MKNIYRQIGSIGKALAIGSAVTLAGCRYIPVSEMSEVWSDRPHVPGFLVNALEDGDADFNNVELLVKDVNYNEQPNSVIRNELTGEEHRLLMHPTTHRLSLTGPVKPKTTLETLP